MARELTARLGRGRAPLVARQPRAGGDVRRRARDGGAAPRRRTAGPKRRPRRRVDRDRAGRRRWRERSEAAAPPPGALVEARRTAIRSPGERSTVSVHEAQRAQAPAPDAGRPSSTARSTPRPRGFSTSRRAGGWWAGELESNVTMTAQHVFLLHFLRLLDEDTLARLRERAPRAAAARRDVGDLPRRRARPRRDDRGVRRAAARRASRPTTRASPAPGASSTSAAAIGASRVFTRMWLALLGQWRWEDIPQIPVEIVLLRSSDAVLGLRLRLLGAADARPALGRHALPAGAARAGRARLRGAEPRRPARRAGRSPGATGC